MSIVIFGDLFSFPEGEAATNRVYTYANGFSKNGIRVHVICFSNDYNTPVDGTIDGVNFYNPFGHKERSSSFLRRRWQKFMKYIKTIALVRNINRNDKIVAINSWTQVLPTLIFAYSLAKLSRSEILIESSEHPLRYYQGSFLGRIKGKVKLYFELKLSDGILCISDYLIQFYTQQGYNPNKLLLIPSTVDPDRFNQNGKKMYSFPYIGYFGGLTFYRDNIDLLVKAFKEVSIKHPDIHLVLGGFCSSTEKDQLKDLITELRLSKKVELLEYLPRQEILNYVANAHVLVMVRSNDLAAAASFPSKLTEFLATAKPVVSVNVGEISNYLTDNVNSFLIEPEDINALIEKLNYVLNNYDIARNVGLRGKELTSTIFNYRYQAGRIIDFINNRKN